MSNQSRQQGTSLGMGEMSGSWEWGIGSRSGLMSLEVDCDKTLDDLSELLIMSTGNGVDYKVE